MTRYGSIPIIDNFTKWRSDDRLNRKPLLRQSFDWIERHQHELPALGEYELVGRDLRVIVQKNAVRSREEILAERGFEAHSREVDLQVCLAGSELIEWASAKDGLAVERPYDSEKDVILYCAPEQANAILMVPGTFVLLFPQHLHLPGIRHEHDEVTKLVFKISLERLLNE